MPRVATRVFAACITTLLTPATVLGSSWAFEGGAQTVLDPGTSFSLQRGAFSSLAWPPATSGAAAFTDEGRGILWMFGGYTKVKFRGHIFKGPSNMLWAYDKQERAWAWFGGGVLLERSDDEPSALPGPLPFVLTTRSRAEAQDPGGPGSIGGAAGRGPGPRYGTASWWDGEGRRFWLFGGVGRGGVGRPIGDLWSLNVDRMLAQASALGRCAQGAPCYSTVASAWTRHSSRGAGAGGGGGGGGGAKAAVEHEHEHEHEHEQEQKQERVTPTPRRLSAGWVVRGHLLLFGGYGAHAWLNDMWSFDLARLRWRRLGGLSAPNGRGNATWPAARTSPTTWRSRCHGTSGSSGSGIGSGSGGQVLWMRGGYAGYASVEGWLADLWACVVVVTGGGDTSAVAVHWQRVRGDLKSDLPAALNSPHHDDDPGSRDRSLSWTQLLPPAKGGAKCARLWLFGGSGFGNSGRFAYKSDVWWFDAPCSCKSLATPGRRLHDEVKWHLAAPSHARGVYRRRSGAHPGARFGSAAWSTLEAAPAPPHASQAKPMRVRFYIFGGHGDDSHVPKPQFDRLSDLWVFTAGTFAYPAPMLRSWRRGGDGGNSGAPSSGGLSGGVRGLSLFCAGALMLWYKGTALSARRAANGPAGGAGNAGSARVDATTEVELLAGGASDKSTAPDTGVGAGVTAYQYQAPTTEHS